MDTNEKIIWILEYLRKKHPILPQYDEIEATAIQENVVAGKEEFRSIMTGLYADGRIAGTIFDREGYFQELTKLPAWNRETHKLVIGSTAAGKVYFELKKQADETEKKIKEIELTSQALHKIESEVQSTNIRTVEILGVFAAVISLVIISSTIIPADKLPPYQDTSAAFWYMLAIIGPFGIVLTVLIILIWAFILPHHGTKK